MGLERAREARDRQTDRDTETEVVRQPSRHGLERERARDRQTDRVRDKERQR